MPSIRRTLAVSLVGLVPSPAVAQPKEVTTLKGHTGIVTSVAYSPDGKTIASASIDKTIRLWEVATGKVLKTIEAVHAERAWVTAVVFSPDGKTLASIGGSSDVRLWDAGTGKQLASLEGHLDVPLTVAFSPDGKRLASGDGRMTVLLWDLPAKGEVVKRYRSLPGRHDAAVRSLAFHPNGKSIASAAEDGYVQVRDVATGDRLSGFKWPGPPKDYKSVRCVAYSPDGNMLAASGWDGVIRFWDASAEMGKETAALKGHAGPVVSVAFSPDGKTLVSVEIEVAGSVPPGGKKQTPRVRLWDVTAGKELPGPDGPTDGVTCAAFSPDGKAFATGNLDSTIKLWRLNPGK